MAARWEPWHASGSEAVLGRFKTKLAITANRDFWNIQHLKIHAEKNQCFSELHVEKSP